MLFTKAVLQEAINALASAGKIYSNEVQSQFELAWELKKKGFDVELEVLSADCTINTFVGLSKDEKKKQYTDIIVKDDEGYKAIELKYKTKDLRKGVFIYTNHAGKHYVFSQGASNEGAYLFWKDVQRLEKIVAGTVPLNFDYGKKVSKGYAVLMTNDCVYWKARAPWSGCPHSLSEEFFPYEGYKPKSPLCKWVYVDASGNLVVEKGNGRPKAASSCKRIINMSDSDNYTDMYKKLYSKSRDPHYDPIILTCKYNCKWEPYSCGITDVEKLDCKGKIERISEPIPEFQ